MRSEKNSRAARKTVASTAIAIALGAALVIGGGQAQAQSTGLGAAIELVDLNVLRVCADPNNMPFSNEAGEGFENKLAELVAAKLDRGRVAYTFFPQGIGFVRNTLGAFRCDIIMGYAQGDELVQNTNPYLRTAYALVVPKGSPLEGVTNLSDPRLKESRIGVVAGTPPATSLAKNGLIGRAQPYQLMVDTRAETPTADMFDDLASGKIDAALAWGPIAGWHAQQADPPHVLVPLVNEVDGPRMTYRITLGVRASDQEWKRTLNRFIRENQDEINALLTSYGIPLLDEKNNLIDGGGG
ncbi:MAG: substrate-binding domain-containing protein [Pseudomonadota bacterium]